MDSKLTHYKNGQVIHVIENGIMTYFYKDGSLKAKGPVIGQIMEGKWMFYRENGQVSQIGHFKKGLKHGSWIRYDKDMNIEYDEIFVEHKIVKRKT